jgi:hypothetical protein
MSVKELQEIGCPGYAKISTFAGLIDQGGEFFLIHSIYLTVELSIYTQFGLQSPSCAPIPNKEQIYKNKS